jgi:hypothetical protein
MYNTAGSEGCAGSVIAVVIALFVIVFLAEVIL